MMSTAEERLVTLIWRALIIGNQLSGFLQAISCAKGWESAKDWEQKRSALLAQVEADLLRELGERP